MPHRVGFLYHPIFLDYDPAKPHVERSSRLRGILRSLRRDGQDGENGINSQLIWVKPQKAPMKWIETVHSKQYIDRFRSAYQKGEPYLDTADCPIQEKTYESALYSAGAGLTAIDRMMKKNAEFNIAFCCIRPPGHHALPNQAMGFCFFNNVAISALYLKKQYSLTRIAILDWDFHHGNGTQDIFEEDPEVLYISLHSDPRFSYPGTGFRKEQGKGKGRGYTYNYPFPPQSEDRKFIQTFELEIVPKIQEYQPEFLLISAGFDGHKNDPLSHFNLSEMTYKIMTKTLVSKIEFSKEKRILSFLEGGYNPMILGKCVRLHIEALLRK